ncbi:uncharacterized protein LOC108628310 [Ceratina calcarata]|uniref:Uncharacterized protein LOC108628310 n=1 Tax=Ceratina calcarata TaxID=156304 RepID=A0AAJ7NAG1_9HYME|nr:uncharacterized protein LOC108628310 [Ceratina calcarata]
MELDIYDEENIKALAEKLDYLPIALQQAAICIRELKFQTISPYEHYLQKYRQIERKFVVFDDRVLRTIFTVYDITLDVMKKEEGAEAAKEILNVLSYFGSEPISTEILEGMMYGEQLMKSATDVLEKYSLIKLGVSTLSVDELLQKLIRYNLTKQKNEEKVVLKSALKLFCNPEIISKNLVHALSVWDHSQKYITLIIYIFPVSMYIVHDLVKCARYDKAYLFIGKLQSLLTNLSGDEAKCYELVTKYHVGKIYLCQKKYEEALSIFDEVLNNPKSGHPLCLEVKLSKGHALHWLERCDEAIKFYQEVYDVRKVEDGENNDKTLFIKQCMEAC